MVERYLLLSVLFLLAGCTSSPIAPESLPSPSPIFNDSNATLPVQNETLAPSSAKTLEEQRLRAKGGGIFDFQELTAANCDDSIVNYRELLDTIEDDLDDLESEFAEEERDLQEALAALRAAQDSGDERAIRRAHEDIDDEEEDVAYVEDLLDEKVEYFRKLKIVFATMKDECPKLKARA